jgi:hypothetical protein
VIAQTEQIEATEAPARDPDSFLAKTIDLKDHVVAATQRMVTTIGSIPSWLGEHRRIECQLPSRRPARQRVLVTRSRSPTKDRHRGLLRYARKGRLITAKRLTAV